MNGSCRAIPGAQILRAGWNEESVHKKVIARHTVSSANIKIQNDVNAGKHDVHINLPSYSGKIHPSSFPGIPALVCRHELKGAVVEFIMPSRETSRRR